MTRTTRTIEFYFDFSSPWTYMCQTQLPALAARHGAEIVYRPAFLGGIFKLTGNNMPGAVPAKATYMLADLQRHARRYDVPFRFTPYFPLPSVAALRGTLVAMQEGYFAEYYAAVWRAAWQEEQNIADTAVLADIITQLGQDPQKFLTAIADPAIKQELIDRTNTAVARGLFGLPTIFVGEEMFFGQDRLDFVAEALDAAV